jgi:hypothetical protein
MTSHPHPAAPACDPAARLATQIAGKLAGYADTLSVALARWMGRDDTKPDADARRAATTAVDEIDAMLRELHALRARLISEIRASDDASAARADELLRRRHDSDS